MVIMPSFDRVTVSGADAGRYLHSQLSQHVERLAVGDETWTFVLEPNGKVDAFAKLRRTDDERYELDVDAGFGAGLVDRLRRFMIRVDVEVTSASVDGPTGPAGFATEDERIAACWPAMGSEVVPGETIPSETGVVDVAVDFGKGCYPGQELVERMDSRGATAPRSLRVLDIGVDVPVGVRAGDDVVDEGGASVGIVTSVGSTAALAYVRRGQQVGRGR
jgi:hypothetical protein